MYRRIPFGVRLFVMLTFLKVWQYNYCYSLTGICCEARLIILRYFKITYKVVVNHNTLCVLFLPLPSAS